MYTCAKSLAHVGQLSGRSNRHDVFVHMTKCNFSVKGKCKRREQIVTMKYTLNTQYYCELVVLISQQKFEIY